jgi:hypothetical protein
MPADIKRYLTTPLDGFENNFITIEKNRLKLVIPHPEIRRIAIDNPLDFLKQYSVVRSHDAPTRLHFNLLKGITRWIYIYRDGRDAINSMMHYVVTPPVLLRHPEYKITSVKKIYQNYEYFAKHVQEWKENAQKAFSFPERFYFVKFEDIVSNKEKFLLELEKKIGVEPPAKTILKRSSFESMHSKTPIHARKGKTGEWKSNFSNKHKAIFKDIAGEMLIKLGYEKNLDW